MQAIPQRSAAAPGAWWRRPAPAIPAAQRRGPLPYLSLVAFTACLLLAPQARFAALGPLHLSALTAALAIGGRIWQQLERREPILACPEDWLAASLALWALATLPVSYSPGGSLQELQGFLLKSLVIYWALGQIVDSRQRLRRFAWTLTLLAIPLAVTALVNLAQGNFIPGAEFPPRIAGYDAPLTGNPNALALMLNLIVPLSVALFLIERAPLVRLFLAGAVALDALAVVATFSRSGALTLVAILAGFLWKLRRQRARGWAWAAVAIGVFCFSLLPAGYLGRLETVTDIASDATGSAQARWNDTIAATGIVLANPIFGVGLGMNIVALNEARGATWTMVHNVYLQYAADLGLPGLLLFLWLFARCLKGVVRLQRRLPADDELARLSLGLELGLVGFAVAGFFSPVGYHFYFFYLAGLAVAARAVAGREAIAAAVPR